MDKLSIIYYSNNLIELLVGKDWKSISTASTDAVIKTAAENHPTVSFPTVGFA